MHTVTTSGSWASIRSTAPTPTRQTLKYAPTAPGTCTHTVLLLPLPNPSSPLQSLSPLSPLSHPLPSFSRLRSAPLCSARSCMLHRLSSKSSRRSRPSGSITRRSDGVRLRPFCPGLQPVVLARCPGLQHVNMLTVFPTVCPPHTTQPIDSMLLTDDRRATCGRRQST